MSVPRADAAPEHRLPMRATLRRIARLSVLLAVVTPLLAACLGQGGGPLASTPRPTPTPTLSAREKAAWTACGASAMPPPAAFGRPSSVPQVQNLTNGAVSTADGEAWAAAFVREQQLENWAQTTLQVGVLQSGCLGDRQAGQQLFGTEVAAMQKARQVGGKLTVQPPRVLDIRIVPVPPDVQQRITGLLQAKSGYALVIHGQGPSATRIAYPDGRQETPADIPDTPAGEAYYAFFGGEYRKAGEGVGPIWFQDSAFDCQRDFLRSVCGV